MSRIDRKAKTETAPKMVKEVATATAEEERNSNEIRTAKMGAFHSGGR